LAGHNAIFLLALILMALPVAGFRPIHAARFRTWRMPRPTEPDFVTLLQMAGGQRHHVAENGPSLLLGDPMAVTQCGGEMSVTSSAPQPSLALPSLRRLSWPEWLAWVSSRFGLSATSICRRSDSSNPNVA
jgi:hypothetical protein